MINSAIKPDFFNNLPTILNNEKLKGKEVSDDEKDLYSLSKSQGWRILKDYMESLMTDLDDVGNIAMNAGMSFEEIGRNTVIANLSKGVIRKVLIKISDAVEACEKPENGSN